MNDNGLRNLLSSKFKLGADASIAAGPVGRHAAADTDWKLRAQLLSYSRTRGVFAGLSLDGAVVRHDKKGDDPRVLWPYAKLPVLSGRFDRGARGSVLVRGPPGKVGAGRGQQRVGDGRRWFFQPRVLLLSFLDQLSASPRVKPREQSHPPQRWEVRVLEILNRAAAGEHPN